MTRKSDKLTSTPKKTPAQSPWSDWEQQFGNSWFPVNNTPAKKKL